MRVGSHQSAAELVVEFSDIERDNTLAYISHLSN